MNTTAQKELLDVIMLDDFVVRREALTKWVLRWVGTLKCDVFMPNSKRQAARAEDPAGFDYMEKAALLDKIFEGVLNAPVKVVSMKVEEGVTNTTVTAKIYTILQEPRGV